ncbi:MAG: septum site-determining protein MinC [Syntrophomonas sp.]
MITIKGLNGNLVFVFGKGSFEEYMVFLKERFESNQQLFSGSRVIFKGAGMDELSPEEIVAIQSLCLKNGMILNNLDTNPERSSSKDLIIHRNVRSGQKLHSEGSVIIWGDVHESAEIMAARDIIVLGKLQGIAHAGCYGELDSIIFALNLCPSQIRIGNKISRSPDDSCPSSGPEIAYWEEGNICIKKYSSKNNLRC